MLVFLLAFALQFQVIGNFGTHLLRKLFLSKSGSFNLTKIGIAVAIIIAIIIVLKILFRRFPHLKLIRAVRNIFTGVWQGIVSIKDLQQKWAFIFSSLGIWAMYLLGTWIGFSGTHGTAGLSLATAVSALAFASIGMIVTPGGIGAFAVFLAKVLQQHGIPYPIGLANGTLQWFAQFLIIVFVGFISLGILPYYNKKYRKHEEARNHSSENLYPSSTAETGGNMAISRKDDIVH